MAKKSKRYRPDKRWFLIGGITLVVAFFSLAGIWVLLKGKHTTPSVVRTQSAVPQATSDRGDQKSSPEYTRKLKELKQQQVEQAEKQGKTYIPPVIDDPAKLLDEEPAKPRVEVKKSEQPKIPTANFHRRGQIQEDPMQQYVNERAKLLAKAIDGELQQIATRQVLEPHTVQVFKTASKTTLRSGTTSQIASGTAATAKDVKQTLTVQKTPPVQVGDVLYGVVEQFLNTDTPVPAFLATILSGPLKGSKLIGTFTRVEDRMTLTFKKLRTPDNTVWGITAYGVDPETTSGALSSDVDHHTFSRWSAIIAASLLEGWAEAVEDSGTSVSVTDDTTLSSTPSYSVLEQAIIASGKVGEKLADKASDYFDTPPTVTLNQGGPVGIVILDISN